MDREIPCEHRYAAHPLIPPQRGEGKGYASLSLWIPASAGMTGVLNHDCHDFSIPSPLDSRLRENDVWASPWPPYAERRGEILNHDCRDGGKIAMIFPSRPLWILACAGMTCGHPPNPLTIHEGGSTHPPGPLRGAKGVFSFIRRLESCFL